MARLRYLEFAKAGFALTVMAAGRLPAQIDYRNLDDERPLFSEDAYPIERHAFEFLLPLQLRQSCGVEIHVPSLETNPFGIRRKYSTC